MRVFLINLFAYSVIGLVVVSGFGLFSWQYFACIAMCVVLQYNNG